MSKEYVPQQHIVEYDANFTKLASSFRCGNDHIDSFLRSPMALDYGIGKTYIWLNEDESEIMGFYNITTGSVEELIDGKICKVGSAIHINEFAIDETYQKTFFNEEERIYISDILLYDCIERVEYIRHHHVGLTFVTLASTKEGINLYQRNDFETMEDDMQIAILEDKEYNCIPMYLPLDIEK